MVYRVANDTDFQWNNTWLFLKWTFKGTTCLKMVVRPKQTTYVKEFFNNKFDIPGTLFQDLVDFVQLKILASPKVGFTTNYSLQNKED